MTRQYNNYEDMITFTRASTGTALRPVTYGDELVTNGTFDTDLTGWTLSGGSATVTDGEAVVSYDGGNGGLYQIITVEVGKLYEIKGSLTAATSSGPRLKVGTTTFGTEVTQLTTVGDINEEFIATTTIISIFVQAITDGSTTVDNISVKEVTFDQPDGTLTLFNHPNNVPRIEYDADGNWKGLLIEESRTNLLTYSNDFSGQWTLTDVVDTANSIASPDGTSNVFYAVANSTSSNFHRFTSSCSIAQSTTYTFSAYLKAGGYTLGGLSFYDGVAYQARTLFDLSDGTINSTVEGSATIEDVGNGWYRCSITGTTDAAASASGTVYISVNSLYGYTGDDASGIYSYGAQLEAGAFPTSYIPTSGSTATRQKDVASMPVSDFGYNVTEGTLLVEYTSFHTYTGTPYPRVLNLYESVSPRAGVEILDFNAVTNPAIYDGGAAQASFTFANNLGKYALAFAENDVAGCGGGGSVSTDTSCTLPIPTTLYIGMYSSSSQLNGHIKSIQYYPRRLSNAQLQALTS